MRDLSSPSLLRPLRARWLGRFWQMALLATVLLLWQQVAGWPFRPEWRPKLTTGEPVQVLRFPKSLQPGHWNFALTQVRREGRPLPAFADRAAFESSRGEACLLLHRALTVRAPEGMALVAGKPSPWVIRVPWALDLLPLSLLLGALLALTVLLATVRNPIVAETLAGVRAWQQRPGRPWPLLTLALAVFLAAIAFRACAFWYPNWEADSPSYFGSVFHVVEGGLPLATPDRPFAYPLLIGTLLRLLPDFRAIVVLQMFATLVAAGALGALVWAAGERLFATAPWLKSGSRLLGIFVFAAFALHESILEREWALLAEASAAFYLGLQAVFVWLLLSRPRSLGGSLWLFAGLSLAGLLTFFTRANWGFALGLLPLPWVVVCFTRAGSRRALWGWAAAGAAVLLTLTAATFLFQFLCRVNQPSTYLYDRARALVCWHVPLIQAELERRLGEEPSGPQSPVLQEIRQALLAELAAARQRGAGSYPSLGFDADELYFRGLPRGPQFAALPVEERAALCASLFREGLRRHPELYLRKVAQQMRLFFTTPYHRGNLYLPEVERGLARSEQALSEGDIPPRFLASYAPEVRQARQEFAAPWPSAARRVLNERTVLISAVLIAGFPWCLGVPAALLAGLACWPAWRRAVEWSAFRPVLVLAAWAFGSAFLSALSAAATQGLDVHRYIQLSSPLILLSQALWPLLALQALRAAAGRRVPVSAG